MSNLFTTARLDELIQFVSELAATMRDEHSDDEADTLEDVESFLRRMVGTDLVTEVQESLEKPPADQQYLLSLAMEQKRLANVLADLKIQTSEARIPYDRLRYEKIPECMAELGIKTVTFAGVGRVQLASDVRASTRKGMKPAAMEWLRDLDKADLIQPTYNMSTLKAMFRHMLIEGAEIPGDIFNVVPLTRASIVKV